jgi:hypothetical protein
MSEFFDFGFTAVDEDELHVVQATTNAAKAIEEEAKDVNDRLDRLYNAIIPLLNNLKKNPEKEYILWPDRLRKVEEFETYIQNIYTGTHK